MKFKTKKTLPTLILTILVTAGLFQMLFVQDAFAGTPMLTAPVIADQTLVPGGDPFRVNITVADVEKLWGFQFSIWYNTTVITAIEYGFYSLFTNIQPSEINDNANATHGYAALSASSFTGDVNGLTTVEAVPIAWIDFIADDFGTTKLTFDRGYASLVNVYGQKVSHILVDGLFTNVVSEVHDIAVINITVSPTQVKAGDFVFVNVTVANQGTLSETFMVTVKYDSLTIGTQLVTDLAVAAGKTLNFVWNTATVAVGVYVISVEADVVLGETDIDDNSLTDGKATILPQEAFVLFDQTHGTDLISWYTKWRDNLVSRGYIVDELITTPITSDILDQYAVLVIPQAHSSYSSNELLAIQSFVIKGGGLLVIGDDAPSIYSDLTGFAGLTWTGGGLGGYTNDITAHPVTLGVASAYFDSPLSDLRIVSPAKDLIRDVGGYIMLGASEMGGGKVLAIADENSIDNGFISSGNNFRLAQNMIDWLTTMRPEHELLVTVTAPNMLKPDEPSLLVATVFNEGINDETNVQLQLLLNGTIVTSASIPTLQSSSSYAIDYLWTPEVEGTYNVTAYAAPILNEADIGNNRATRLVTVAEFVKAVVLDSWGTDYYTGAWPTLNSDWHIFGNMRVYVDFTSLNKDGISYNDLVASGADVLMISCAYAWQFTDEEIAAISQYVKEGHGLIATAGTLYEGVPNNNKLAPLFGISDTVRWTTTSTNMLDILDIAHPLFKNVPDPYTMQWRGTTLPYDGRWDINELTSGTYVALGQYRESAIVVNNGLVFITPWVEYLPDQNDLQLLYNAITWSRYIPPLTMQIQPDRGPVGTSATVYGNEAAPDANIEFYFDNTLVGTVTAANDGNFIFVFDVPASTAGSHVITAIETATHRKGVTTFNVIPSISLDPISGPVGTKVTVNGCGYVANVQIIMTFDDTFVSSWVITDATGSFTTTLNVPVSAAGLHKIKAFTYIYRPPDYKQELLSADAEFTVLNISPLMVNVDVGEIFFKGETVEFYVQTAFEGRTIDASTIDTTLHMPDGTTQKLTAQHVSMGLYKLTYALNRKGSMLGTYMLFVEASYVTDSINAYGTQIKTFIVKSTWELQATRMTAVSIAAVGLVSAMVLLWRKEKKKAL